MLQAVQAEGRLRKVATDTVKMTPTPVSEMLLSELNVLIAEQRGVTVDELYTLVSGAPKAGEQVTETPAPAPNMAAMDEAITTNDAPLSDEDLAKSYRSQADRLSKEAAQLRRQAEELVPTKKASTKVKQEA